MYKFSRFIDTMIVVVFCLTFASIAQAQATRTWVSGVGDDANPCSRTAPCKTFAGAISKTAPSGEIDVLDPGGFGALTITKSITIDGGEGQVAGVLVSGTNGIVIAAGANDVVTIRNLDIDGLGTGLDGIKVISAKSVHVDHCQIYGFSTNAIDVAIGTQAFLSTLFVNDCFIRGNANGIGITSASAGTVGAFIDSCRIHGNTGFGVSGSNGNSLTLLRCDVSGNGGEGVKVDTGAGASIFSCLLNSNLSGAVGSGASLLLADSTIIANGTGVSGTTVTTFGNNNVRFNGGGNTLPAPVGQQ